MGREHLEEKADTTERRDRPERTRAAAGYIVQSNGADRSSQTGQSTHITRESTTGQNSRATRETHSTRDAQPSHDPNPKREVTDENGLDLIDITGYLDAAWKCLKRCWLAFLVIISLCASVGWVAAERIYVPSYTASCTFIVTTVTTYTYYEDSYNQSTASQLSETFPYIISNSAMQHLIEEDLGVESVPGTIEAEAMTGTNLITIKVTAASGQLAYDILQSVLANYPTVGRAVIGDTNLQMVEESGIPTSPSNSSSARRWAEYGLLAGFAICVAWVVYSVATRKTISRSEDLKSQLNIRSLSAVPKVQFKKRRSDKRNLVLLDNDRVSNSFKEAYRTARVRIEHAMREKGYKVFLVSSANEGEGKTTVSVNLALSLAERGKQVILIDLDLRNPSVLNCLGIKDKVPGITEVIQGKAVLNDILLPYGDGNLQIVPGGRTVQMPSRALTGKVLRVVFKVLRERADCVIIDTPPSGLLSDAALIARYADAGIFVVRQDYTSVERIKEGIEMLTDTDLPLVGCVMNYMQAGITGYGYGYGYTGKYGYEE